MNAIRDWIVNHPTSSQSFNVVIWIGAVGAILGAIIRKLGGGNGSK